MVKRFHPPQSLPLATGGLRTGDGQSDARLGGPPALGGEMMSTYLLLPTEMDS